MNGGNPVPRIIARSSFPGEATTPSSRQKAASLTMGSRRRDSITSGGKGGSGFGSARNASYAPFAGAPRLPPA